MSTFKWLRPFLGVGLIFLAPLAQGVMCEEAWKVQTQGDADYETAVRAVEREDWTTAVAALEKVTRRRAWDDAAHTLLGLAYRRLGNHHASLEHYRRALELNPYHPGALEYLGEAYLELGDYGRASEMLERLAAACRRVNGRQACPEWHELKAAIEARGVQTETH